MIKVGIVGGTGYTGLELLRFLACHPKVDITVITSRSEAGVHVTELFSSLRGYIDLKFSDPSESKLDQCDVVFFATPNGIAMQQAEELVKAGVRVIDLAADFRIKDVAEWEKWYGMSHACPELVAEAVYGLPEINREQIKGAKLIANPGCYPTAVQLGFLPIVEAGIVDINHLIADVKSGVSGAGRKAAVHTLHAEASDNFKAYGLKSHRHTVEIQEQLSGLRSEPLQVQFTPHLLPVDRGILSTIYTTPVREEVSDQAIRKLYEDFYADAPFVRLRKTPPTLKDVRSSNFCDIFTTYDERTNRIITLAAIDNLVKGAAGQAMQNMNLQFGLPETRGFVSLPLNP